MTFLTFSIAGSGSVFFREELADDFHGGRPCGIAGLMSVRGPTWI